MRKSENEEFSYFNVQVRNSRCFVAEHSQLYYRSALVRRNRRFACDRISDKTSMGQAVEAFRFCMQASYFSLTSFVTRLTAQLVLWAKSDRGGTWAVHKSILILLVLQFCYFFAYAVSRTNKKRAAARNARR